MGTEASIVAEYTEIESGRKNSRPQLQAAIARAKQADAVLLVAKLDRVARNMAFLATLMESHVRFKAVDLPAADELTLHILAAVAQKEARRRPFGVPTCCSKCKPPIRAITRRCRLLSPRC